MTDDRHKEVPGEEPPIRPFVRSYWPEIVKFPDELAWVLPRMNEVWRDDTKQRAIAVRDELLAVGQQLFGRTLDPYDAETVAAARDKPRPGELSLTPSEEAKRKRLQVEAVAEFLAGTQKLKDTVNQAIDRILSEVPERMWDLIMAPASSAWLEYCSGDTSVAIAEMAKALQDNNWVKSMESTLDTISKRAKAAVNDMFKESNRLLEEDAAAKLNLLREMWRSEPGLLRRILFGWEPGTEKTPETSEESEDPFDLA